MTHRIACLRAVHVTALPYFSRLAGFVSVSMDQRNRPEQLRSSLSFQRFFYHFRFSLGFGNFSKFFGFSLPVRVCRRE